MRAPAVRPDPARVRRGRWPWGSAAVTGAAGAGTWAAGTTGDAAWWSGLPVPRSPGPAALLGPGSAVPVAGPGTRDADGDAVAETLVVAGRGGWTLWVDADGDGLADRVTGVAVPPGPDPLATDPPGLDPLGTDPSGTDPLDADLLGADPLGVASLRLGGG